MSPTIQPSKSPVQLVNDHAGLSKTIILRRSTWSQLLSRTSCWEKKLLLFFSTPKKLTCHLKRNHFNKKAVFQPASLSGYSSVFRGVKKNQIFPNYIFDLLHIAVFWDSFNFALGMFGKDLSISSIIKHPEKYHYFPHCLLNILIFS